MKWAFISAFGDGLSIAYRMLLEGSKVKVWAKDPKAVYKGFFPFTSTYESAVAGVDVAIFDHVGFGKKADALRKRGVRVIGASGFGDRIELDRLFGIGVMKVSKIRSPKMHSFTSYSEAERFVIEHPQRYVVKLNDNVDTVSTYVASSADDMLEKLSDYQRRYPKAVVGLQKFVEGVEVSCEGWFNGESFVEGFTNCTFEEKQFMDFNKGPTIGCAGNVVMQVSGKLPKETVYKLTPTLRRMKFVGPIDINSIISQADHLPHGLEFTPRFGYDAIQTLLSMWDGKIEDFFTSFLSGKGELKWKVGAGVRVTVPPYPSTPDPKMKGKSHFAKFLPNDLWATDVSRKGTMVYSNAYDGVVGVATGVGHSAFTALQKAYKVVDKIHLVGKQYRSDIGYRMQEEVALLEKWGYTFPKVGKWDIPQGRIQDAKTKKR